MKKLEDILESILVLNDYSGAEVVVTDLEIDSRVCKPGCLFVAYRGTDADSHTFIASAVENGASVVLLDDKSYLGKTDAVYILVENAREVISRIAANFYDHPSSLMTVVGVTGTNGKTTTSDLLYKLYRQLGYNSGLISTISVSYGTMTVPSRLTTPDAISLQCLFREMCDSGVSHVFMEVSSHAIHQGRVADVDFDHVVFTNLTHDHLDYHKTFRAYLNAKKLLFDNLPDDKTVLTNIDDKNGLVMTQNSSATVHTYALRVPAHYKGKVISNEISGLHMVLDDHEVILRMIGRFNAYNALAVYGTAVILGEQENEILQVLSNLSPAEGRMELVRSPKVGYTAIVDYAHTPDALDKILKTLVEIKLINTKLITVVGCGGDRDKTKRPKMAKVSRLYSDVLILTSDNPRTENPDLILDDMYAGLSADNMENVIRITNRQQAIKTACLMAGDGDVILIAGKGHEKYQDIRGEKVPFDDKKIVKSFMN